MLKKNQFYRISSDLVISVNSNTKSKNSLDFDSEARQCGYSSGNSKMRIDSNIVMPIIKF